MLRDALHMSRANMGYVARAENLKHGWLSRAEHRSQGSPDARLFAVPSCMRHHQAEETMASRRTLTVVNVAFVQDAADG